MKKTPTIIISLLVVLLLVVVAYWYLFLRGTITPIPNQTPNSTSGFTPLNGNSSTGNSGNTNNNPGSTNTNPGSTGTTSVITAKIPSLRLLSNTPVGGYGSNTTGSTTRVRWVDRGRGNIYEVVENTPSATTLSNTILPRVNESVWNANLTAFIGSLVPDNNTGPTTIYSALAARASTTAATSTATDQYTPFQLKGNNLPAGVITYAVSPKKDRVFLLINQNGVGVGYVANFNGSAMKHLFDTPLTQVTADWPETNTITLLTNPSLSDNGFFYFVNATTGYMNKVLGPIPGLIAVASHDAKYVVYSGIDAGGSVATNILTVSKNTSIDALIKTLANKCVWGNFYKSLVYCGVPRSFPTATYPDSWLLGAVSFADKIWQVNADTGEAHLISIIVDQSDRVIDAFNLGLDQKDNYLFFMNKSDLSLWSLDLVSTN